MYFSAGRENRSAFRVWRSSKSALSIAALALVVWSQAHATQIIYVNHTVSPTAPQSGSSWATAYRELADAFHSPSFHPTAENPVEIWVAAGTYLPSVNQTNRTASFVL